MSAATPLPRTELAPVRPRPGMTIALGVVATGLLVVVVVLAITGVIRPVWSHPDPGPAQTTPTAPYRPPPPMAVDLRLLPAPSVGDQP